MTLAVKRRGWVWVIASALLAPLMPSPAASAVQTPAIVVTGASYIEVDDRSGVWEMRGDPVTVSRGRQIVRAMSMTYDSRSMVLSARGRVQVEDERVTASAATAVAYLQEERLLAEGEVVAMVAEPTPAIQLRADRLEVWSTQQRALATGAVTLTRGDVTVTGVHLAYDLRAHQVVATSRPKVTIPHTTVTADRIAVQLDQEELTADGSVQLTADELEGSAPMVVVQNRAHLATLSGGAIIRQGRNELRAEVVTIDLERRQIVATGGAHVIVYPNR